MTVDAVIPRDELRRIPAGIVISRQFVSAIAVAPGAAAPTSSLPYYLADFDGLRAWAAADEPLAFARAHSSGRHDGATAPSALALARLSRLPEIDEATVAAALPAPPDDPSPATPDEWMTVWLARAVPGRLGLLGRRGVAARFGVVPPRQGNHRAVDDAHHQRRLLHRRRVAPGALRARRVARLVLGAHDHGWRGELRVVLPGWPGVVRGRQRRPDRRDPAGPTTARSSRRPGGGSGSPARAAWPTSRTCTAISSSTCRASRRSIRPSESSSRRRRAACSRRPSAQAAGYQPGKVALVTNLAVFRLDEGTGRFRVAEVFPWTTIDELRDATGFELGITSLDGIPVVPAPTTAELDALRRRVDPLGIRKLEFVPSRDRGPLLEQTIRAEATAGRSRARAPVLPDAAATTTRSR